MYFYDCFINLVSRYAGVRVSDNVATPLALIAHWLCYFNSAINPVIYNLMSGTTPSYSSKNLVLCGLFLLINRCCCCCCCQEQQQKPSSVSANTPAYRIGSVSRRRSRLWIAVWFWWMNVDRTDRLTEVGRSDSITAIDSCALVCIRSATNKQTKRLLSVYV